MSRLLLLPPNSRAWTAVSIDRAQLLMRTDNAAGGFEVEFKRFLGRDGWRPLTSHTQHEARTRYRARKLNSP